MRNIHVGTCYEVKRRGMHGEDGGRVTEDGVMERGGGGREGLERREREGRDR